MAKILMIQIQAYPYIGTAYLNAAARSAGHTMVLHLGNNINNILKVIQREQPDCIGFSMMTSFMNEILAIARKIKEQKKILMVAGGPHPTLFPDIIKDPSIDAICRGEGEFAIIDLLDALDQNKPLDNIANLWVKRNGEIIRNPIRPLVENLDTIPLIDWSCYVGTPVLTSSPLVFPIRGCPYSCTYCFNESMRKIYQGLGPYVRCFSTERAIEETKQALKYFQESPVFLCSDTFGIDTDWMEEFLKCYTKLTSQPFILLLRPELATEHVIKIISQYNCHSVAIGVESGSERVRREILNRRYTNELLLRVASNLHNAGIPFKTYNMLGLPTETEDEMWETIDLNIQMKADVPRAVIFTPLPNTKIVDIAIHHGCLEPDFDIKDIPASSLQGSIIKGIDNTILLSTLYLFQTAVLLPRFRDVFRKRSLRKPSLVLKLWFYIVYVYYLYVYLYGKIRLKYFFSFTKFMWANRNTKV